jgi:hypothetical protein
MSNLFKTLELEAFRKGITPRTQQSRNWFRVKASQLGKNVSRSSLMQEEEIILKSRTIIGSMCMFFYDPKHKDTLPYYDRFPLTIIIGPAPGGFYGLNLHYLPPILRAKFLDGLMDITSNKAYDETTKFSLTYDLLQRAIKFKYFKPCLKHYLSDQVRSKFAFVQAPEWEIATFLPTADFAKAGKSTVYKDSRRKINQ